MNSLATIYTFPESPRAAEQDGGTEASYLPIQNFCLIARQHSTRSTVYIVAMKLRDVLYLVCLLFKPIIIIM